MNAKELIELYQAGERDFSGIDFDEFNPSEASMIYLVDANFTGANFSNAFEDTAENDPAGVIRIYPGVNLSRLDLRGCNFSFIQLMNANFTGTNLQSAMFIFTDLRGADFTNADLRDANLDGAGFNSQYNEIDRAIICNTTMPNGKIRNYNC